MKKILSILLCTAMMLGIFSQTTISTYAAETEFGQSKAVANTTASGYTTVYKNGFTFKVYINYAELTEFDEELYSIYDTEYNTTHVLKIPGSIIYDNNEYPVTEITARFSPDTSFTTVFIPKTVKYITDINAGNHDSSSIYPYEYCAFQHKTNLEYVIFENGSQLESLSGHFGWWGRYNKEGIYILERYYYGCFYGCTNLKRIGVGNTDKLPDGLTKIEHGTFYNCKSLKSITCPDNLTEIGHEAFQYCSSLERITFSSKLNTIGWYTFDSCENIKELSIPATISNIVGNAFSNCKGLEKVTFETYKIGTNKGKSSLASLEDKIFFNCTNLKKVELPLSIKSYSISTSCFENTSLTSINIPASVNSVFSRAFANTKLENNLKTKDGQKYAVGFFYNNMSISDNIFGDTYSNVDEDKVPKIAGIDESSTAYRFAVKTFGREYFVALGDYNPYEKEEPVSSIYSYGDIDGDGIISSADALLVLRRSVGLEIFNNDQLKFSDVDGDSAITSADSLAILRYSVGFRDRNILINK